MKFIVDLRNESSHTTIMPSEVSMAALVEVGLFNDAASVERVPKYVYNNRVSQATHLAYNTAKLLYLVASLYSNDNIIAVRVIDDRSEAIASCANGQPAITYDQLRAVSKLVHKAKDNRIETVIDSHELALQLLTNY